MLNLQPHYHPVPESFQEACAECGEVTHRRQYTRVGGRHTCEQCLLIARKQRGAGWKGSLRVVRGSACRGDGSAGAGNRPAFEAGGNPYLLLARHHFSKLDDLREVYWGSLLHDISRLGCRMPSCSSKETDG